MISLQDQERIIIQLREKGVKGVLDYTPFPEPYVQNVDQVKAILLGCDPSNKQGKRFRYAFALPTGEEYGFTQFVRGHQSNLQRVGLDWDSVYVQNLCQNYFDSQTAENWIQWRSAAELWIPRLKDELSMFSEMIPVLLTAEVLYRVLLKIGTEPIGAKELYMCQDAARIPIPAESTTLGRPLIPFYRHPMYHLSYPRWSHYAVRVGECLGWIQNANQ
jgi:hypothetical protein